MRRLALLLATALLLQGCGFKLPERAARMKLTETVKAAGASEVETRNLDDGGLQVNGKIEGRKFSLAFPQDWDGRNAMVFASGYSVPGTKTVLDIPDNPVEEDLSSGLMKYAYLQGYAVGMSAYDKAGLGVQTGTERTFALREYLARVGAQRVWLSGASMGGNIVVSLLENHPDAFVGALDLCGASTSFADLTGSLIDMRAVYDFYTAGTPYAMPGSHDLNVSMIDPQAPPGLRWANSAWGLLKIKGIFEPVMRLFEAAKADPKGKEAEIVRKVSAITGWDAEPASFALPLLTIGLGMDDMRETSGGNFYDNTAKVYGASILSADEAAALNKGVARIKGDAAGIAYMRQWHDARGNWKTPLVALHNGIDSLAPYSQATQLRERALAAGNAEHIALLTVPPLKLQLPFTTLDGYMHCGFRPQQVTAAWDELRHWVDTGAKPADGARP